MGYLDSRNAAAFRSAQWFHDNAEPEADDGRADYIAAQVEEFMQGEDVDHLDFFTFAPVADEALAHADDREFAMVQIVMACSNGKFELAQKLARRFKPTMERVAAGLIDKSLDCKDAA